MHQFLFLHNRRSVLIAIYLFWWSRYGLSYSLFCILMWKKCNVSSAMCNSLYYAAHKHNFTTQWTLANSNKYNSVKVKIYSMLLLIIWPSPKESIGFRGPYIRIVYLYCTHTSYFSFRDDRRRIYPWKIISIVTIYVLKIRCFRWKIIMKNNIIYNNS